MTGALWRSAFVAAVFAIHPLRVESVAWVTERKDVLSGLFFLLTLLCYARAVTRDKGQVTGTSIAPVSLLSLVTCHLSPFYWLAVMFFALGLMAKTILVTVPFVLLLLDYWPLGRSSGFKVSGSGSAAKGFVVRGFNGSTLKRLLIEKIPFFVLSAAACVATFIVQQRGGAVAEVTSYAFGDRLANVFVSYARYLGKTFWPVNLTSLYPFAGHWPLVEVLLAAALFAGLSAAALRWGWRFPYAAVGWFWFVGMLVPVIGLVQVGGQSLADRYTYLPQIGLCILVAWGAVEVCGSWRWRLVALGSVAGVVLAGLLAVSYTQTGYWKNSVSLWTHALASTSGNFMAENYLGVTLADQGSWDEAIRHYESALRLNPHYAAAFNNLGFALAVQGKWAEAMPDFERALQLNPDLVEAHYNLGRALSGQGKLADAIQEYDRALELDPDRPGVHIALADALAGQGRLVEATRELERALQLTPEQAAIYNGLGNLLSKQGKLAEAIGHYERAVELKPDYAEAHRNLGSALARQGRLAEAIEHCQRALQLDPRDAEACNTLGFALAAQGKWDEAIPSLQRALELKPDYADAHVNLGVALANQGKWAEAVQHYEQALARKPDYVQAHNDLGVALAAQGKWAEAVQHYERALQLDPNFAQAHNNLGIALAALGKTDQAIPQFQEALRLATARNDAALADSIRQRLKLYQPALPPAQAP